MVCMAHYVTLTPSLKANIVWLSYERKDAFFLSLFRWVNDFSTHFSRWFIVSKNASTAATESNFKTQRLSVFPETSSIYGAGVGVTNHTWTASDVAGISGICSCSCLDTNAPPSEKNYTSLQRFNKHWHWYFGIWTEVPVWSGPELGERKSKTNFSTRKTFKYGERLIFILISTCFRRCLGCKLL